MLTIQGRSVAIVLSLLVKRTEKLITNTDSVSKIPTAICVIIMNTRGRNYVHMVLLIAQNDAISVGGRVTIHLNAISLAIVACAPAKGQVKGREIKPMLEKIVRNSKQFIVPCATTME